MQHEVSELKFFSERLDSPSVFKIFVAYEDAVAGTEARRVCENLTHSLRAVPEFDSSLWKFDALEIGCLAQVATKEAVAADMVIVSLRQPESLSFELKNWFASWACSGSSETHKALVLLMDKGLDDSSEAEVIYNYFKTISGSARMDFFASYQAMHFAAKPAWHPGNRVVDFEAAGGEQIDHSGWGLNE